MKKIKFFAFMVITSMLATSVNAQGEETPEIVAKHEKKPSNWKLESIYSLNITQSSFTNWAAGGSSNISGLGFINGFAEYNKGRYKWSNTLTAGLGGIKYFDTPLQKTDDVLDIQSTLSYGFKDPWYISLIGGFKTQFLNGYADIADTIYSSRFMAPGYLNTSLGIEFIPNDNMKVFLSPISGKFTFVNDPYLSSIGAFGVDPGKTFRPELGAYFRFIYKKEIFKNINFRSRLELFTNYLHNPQNIDVNAEVIFDFKINNWFSAMLQLNLLYDDDIDIKDRHGNVGPRTQFKQVLAIGISYRLANFVEKKD